MSDLFINGMPGVSSERLVSFRRVFRGMAETWLSGGKQIDGTYSRDPSNTGNVNVLLPGVIMGKRTSGGLYAPSIYGLTNAALTNSGTSLTLASAAIGTEILRRVGAATGTFKLTGPPTAAGTVRTLTATFSAISSTTATITALGVNEVQTMTFGAAATGGTMRLRVPKANGEFVLTDAITWNGTDATWLASINTALDGATGVTGGIVATGAAPDTALTFTFSGTGYAGLPQPTEMISVETSPTSVTTVDVVRTTTGVDGRFVSGSFIQPVDGSETPLTFTSELSGGIVVTDSAGTNLTVPFHRMPIGGEVDESQFINYPSDTSLRTWLRSQLSTASGGKFTFGGVY